MSNAVEEAIEQVTSGLTALAVALSDASGGDDDEGGDTRDDPWTEAELKALEREDLLSAAEAEGVEVKKGQKGPTIIKAILEKQEAKANEAADEPDNDDPADDEKAEKKKAKKKDKKAKGKGKSKGRGKE